MLYPLGIGRQHAKTTTPDERKYLPEMPGVNPENEKIVCNA